MGKNPSFTAVIPARAGSKGVPKKNIRMLGGLPVFAWSVRAAQEAQRIDRVVVSTDDIAIINWCELNDVEYSVRDHRLADDVTPLSHVAKDLVEKLNLDGSIIILQPTSPFRSAKSIDSAITEMLDRDCQSLMSVVRENHLMWKELSDHKFEPLFKERVNRQFAQYPVLKETGAIQISSVENLLSTGTMISPNHHLFEIATSESEDIDTWADFMSAQNKVNSGLVIFRIIADRLVGSGHLFHSLRIAEELLNHKCKFLLKDCDDFAAEMISEAGYEAVKETDLRANIEQLIQGFANSSTVVVNDVLDTEKNDLLVQHSLGARVVCMEDLGAGPDWADVTINALYSPTQARGKVLSGIKWAPVRHEFDFVNTGIIPEIPKRILITFGGTDPNNLSSRISALLVGCIAENIEVQVVLGPGSSIQKFSDRVQVLKSVKNMASLMASADLIITSAGRTVVEAAIVGTPIVVLAQNAREATHSHIGLDDGVIFLGIGPLVDDSHIKAVISRLLEDFNLRSELSDRLRKGVDTKGAHRIARILENLIDDPQGELNG